MAVIRCSFAAPWHTNCEASHSCQILERLDNEIEHERARIRTLEEDEQNLLKHHERAASYVRNALSVAHGLLVRSPSRTTAGLHRRRDARARRRRRRCARAGIVAAGGVEEHRPAAAGASRLVRCPPHCREADAGSGCREIVALRRAQLARRCSASSAAGRGLGYAGFRGKRAF